MPFNDMVSPHDANASVVEPSSRAKSPTGTQSDANACSVATTEMTTPAVAAASTLSSNVSVGHVPVDPTSNGESIDLHKAIVKSHIVIGGGISTMNNSAIPNNSSTSQTNRPVTIDDLFELNAALFPEQQPVRLGEQFIPIMVGLWDFLVEDVRVFVHMQKIVWHDRLAEVFLHGGASAPPDAFAGEGSTVGAWKVLLVALYGGAGAGGLRRRLGRVHYRGPDFANALRLAARWEVDSPAVIRGLAALMRDHFRNFAAAWAGIPSNGLTCDLHKDLYAEVVRTFLVYKRLPPPFQPFPLRSFGSLISWFGRDSLLTLRHRTDNPDLCELLTMALT